AYFPLLRRRRDQHFARSSARLPQWQPRIGDTAAAAGSVVIDLGICWCLLDTHLLPIEAELLSEDHGQRSHHALAHLGLAEDESDAIVLGDAHPGVQRIDDRLFLLLRGIRGAGGNVEADEQSCASCGAGLEEGAATDGVLSLFSNE